jgi:hypothetical protein
MIRGGRYKGLEQLPTGVVRRSERSYLTRAFGLKPTLFAFDFVFERVEEDTAGARRAEERAAGTGWGGSSRSGPWWKKMT